MYQSAAYDTCFAGFDVDNAGHPFGGGTSRGNRRDDAWDHVCCGGDVQYIAILEIGIKELLVCRMELHGHGVHRTGAGAGPLSWGLH